MRERDTHTQRDPGGEREKEVEEVMPEPSCSLLQARGWDVEVALGLRTVQTDEAIVEEVLGRCVRGWKVEGG